MQCGECRKEFSEYLDDRLPQPDREGLEAHLRTCPACQGEWAAFQRTVAALRALPEPQVSPGFAARVRERAEEGSRLTRVLRSLFLPPSRRIPVHAAAALVVAVGAVVLYRSSQDFQQSPFVPPPAPPATQQETKATPGRAPAPAKVSPPQDRISAPPTPAAPGAPPGGASEARPIAPRPEVSPPAAPPRLQAPPAAEADRDLRPRQKIAPKTPSPPASPPPAGQVATEPAPQAGRTISPAPTPAAPAAPPGLRGEMAKKSEAPPAASEVFQATRRLDAEEPSLTLRVQDIAAAGVRVREILQGLGGRIVEGYSVAEAEGKKRETSLVVSVPAERADEFLRAVRGIGRVVGEPSSPAPTPAAPPAVGGAEERKSAEVGTVGRAGGSVLLRIRLEEG